MTEQNKEGWPRVHYAVSSGQTTCGLELFAYVGHDLTEAEKTIISVTMYDLERKLLAESTRTHPDNIAWKIDWIYDAKAMFRKADLNPIYVREIPNEYCNCCPHRVWLSVTTVLGTFKVGWRKSVIVVDWTDTDVKALAEDLFASENVTKGDWMIHAYGYEKATEYLKRIFEHANIAVM